MGSPEFRRKGELDYWSMIADRCGMLTPKLEVEIEQACAESPVDVDKDLYTSIMNGSDMKVVWSWERKFLRISYFYEWVVDEIPHSSACEAAFDEWTYASVQATAAHVFGASEDHAEFFRVQLREKRDRLLDLLET
jgi:hypothetical protein